MESIIRNIDSLEESQSHITKLIEQLDRDSRQNDNTEVGFLLTGMEEKLGQFSENHFELQREIEELLESSRRGVLTHEKLTDMVNAEQVRTQYLSNIVDSLKTQIESLFNKLISATDDEESNEPVQIVEQVSDNVNLLWKSVDSLSKLIGSPTKKLEYNIQKIDSEVIVHLNKTLHLHDRNGANNNGKENFTEKVESQIKARKTSEKKQNNPSRTQTPIKDSQTNKTVQSIAAISPQPPTATVSRKESQGRITSPPPSVALENPLPLPIVKVIPPEQTLIDIEVNRNETYQTAEEVVESKRKSSKAHATAASKKKLSVVKAPTSDVAVTEVNEADAPEISQPPTARQNPDEAVANTKSKGRKRSKGNEAHAVSNKSAPAGATSARNTPQEGVKAENSSGSVNETVTTKPATSATAHRKTSVGSNPASTTVPALNIGNDGNKSNVRKESLHSAANLMDDEASLNSISPLGAEDAEDGFPHDRKSLIQLIEEKEKEIKDQKNSFDIELKKQVKEYLRSHGIGFGANHSSFLEPNNEINSVVINDSFSLERPSSMLNKVDNQMDVRDSGRSPLSIIENIRRTESPSNVLEPVGGSNNNNSNYNTNRPSTSGTTESNDLNQPRNYNYSNISSPTIKGTPDKRLLIRTELSRNNLDLESRTPVKPNEFSNGGDPAYSSYYPSAANTNGRNSRAPSNFPSRVPSREGGIGKGKYLLSGYDNSAPLSRQQSLKGMMTRTSSYKEELSEIKLRLRQLHHQDHDADGDGDGNNGTDENDAYYSSERQQFLDKIIETMYINIRSGQTVTPSDWNLIRLTAPNETSSSQKKEEKTTSTEDLQEWIQHRLFELPIYDNQSNILVTRTYKITPEQSTFLEQLQQAVNPLFFIYQEYHPYLSQLQKERLFYASLLATTQQHTIASDAPIVPAVTTAMPRIDMIISQRNRRPILAAAHHLLATANRLTEECNTMIPLINTIESLVNDSVQIVKTLNRPVSSTMIPFAQIPNGEYLFNSLSDLYRLMGIVEAQELTINFRVIELRSFFESIQAIDVKELGILLQESADLKVAYEKFSETQGNMLEVHRRLAASKDRAKRYQLIDFLLQQQQQQSVGTQLVQTRGGYQTTTSTAASSAMNSPTKLQSLASPPHGMISIMNDQQLIKHLQDELKAAEEEIEDLEFEMIQMLKEKDKTPSAILFFSLMHDASFIPNLQQLLLQFKFIKSFLDYSENMDYVTLRKRLQVCLILMPSIDKLVDKYSNLYKQWSYYRLNWFAERKVRGSASDGMNYCPLCYNDISEKHFPITAAMAAADSERIASNAIALAPLHVGGKGAAHSYRNRGGAEKSNRLRNRYLSSNPSHSQASDILSQTSTSLNSQIHRIPTTLSKSSK